ncbi:hypothetical protein F4861DRAFT_502424 [Xylaria intraflava]|nr:hypothetical protein F4861DRAFT_502424 [Xylaria intraflava]
MSQKHDQPPAYQQGGAGPQAPQPVYHQQQPYGGGPNYPGYGPNPGMSYQQQPGGYYPPQQSGPYYPPQQGPGYYPPQQQGGYYPPQGGYYQDSRAGAGAGGCLGALLGALACCCCLDLLF